MLVLKGTIIIPVLYDCLPQDGHGKTSQKVGLLYLDIHKQ